MSSVVLFNRKYLPLSVNIHSCFSAERKNILPPIVLSRPWANGLNRLLAERRGLKKGKLAELGQFRPALISSVLNAPTPPEIDTLMRIAMGFTKFDRKHDPKAPDVELWEFFVTDEQAAVLRERAVKAKAASDDEVLLARAMQLFTESLSKARAEQAEPPAPPRVVAEDPHLAKGRKKA